MLYFGCFDLAAAKPDGRPRFSNRKARFGMAMMGLFEDVAQEAGRYRDAANFSAQLKDHVLNVPPVATADVVGPPG